MPGCRESGRNGRARLITREKWPCPAEKENQGEMIVPDHLGEMAGARLEMLYLRDIRVCPQSFASLL